MKKVKLTPGAVLVIAVAVLVCVVAALRYLGDHKAEIGAGIGVLLQVAAFLAVAAGIFIVAWKLVQARQSGRAAPPEPDAPPLPVHVPSERVPLTSTSEEPLALPPGGTHFHFGDMDEESAARLIRLIRGDDRDE